MNEWMMVLDFSHWFILAAVTACFSVTASLSSCETVSNPEFGGNVFLAGMFTACQPSCWIPQSVSISIWLQFFFFETTSVELRNVRAIFITASFLPHFHQFTWCDSVYCGEYVHYGSKVIFLDVTHSALFLLVTPAEWFSQEKTKIFNKSTTL